MEEQAPGTPHHRHQKRRKSQHSHKPNPYKNLEDIISKHLLKVIGIIFILAVLGYSVSSLGKLRGLVKHISSSENVVQQPSGSSPAVGLSGSSEAVPRETFEPADVTMMIIVSSICTILFAALLLFSIRIHRKEIPRIAGAVFFALAFLMARKYGWQIHVLFPMIMIFTVLIIYSSFRLHSMVAVKWNLIVFWGFFMIWWAIKLILGGGAGLLPGFFIYGCLFFLLFLLTGAYGGFSGHHRFSDYAEIVLIIMNTAVFYILGIACLIKFRYHEFAWIFSLGVASANLGILIFANSAGKKILPGPYVFPAIVILSLIFPFIFQVNAMILFLAILSFLLLFYSKHSGDRIAVITALVSIVLMLLVYLKDWVFQYLPAAFLGNVLDNRAMMVKGLVAGLVIFPVMLINNRLVKKLHVDLSKEWFSRRGYQNLFKGINLIVLYLSGFWVVNYYVLVISKSPDLNYMSWFGYNCLFFIITLPMLSAQKSRFLAAAIGFAMFFTLAYPSLIHISTLHLRNEILIHEKLSSLIFWFHYPIVLLFIAEIIVLAVYIRKTFEMNAVIIRVFTLYLLLMCLFILLSEYDHLSIWSKLKRGVTIEEIALANRVIPYTLILLGFSGTILLSGLISRNKLLRAAGLVFLVLTLVKMLYIDLRVLSGTTRTIVLFAVGVVVITISFMYPKFKRYFRHREHEAKVAGQRHRRHSHRKSVSIPGNEMGESQNETLSYKD